MILRTASGSIVPVSSEPSAVNSKAPPRMPTKWPRPPVISVPPSTTTAIDCSRYGSPMPKNACPLKPERNTPTSAEQKPLSM